MKTGCKSCQNWTQKNGDEGWCANFKRMVFHNPSCGEWRLRDTACAKGGSGPSDRGGVCGSAGA